MTLRRGGCLGCHSDAEPTTNGVASVNGFVSALAMMAIDRKQAALYFAHLCENHRRNAMACLDATAKANGQSFGALSRSVFEMCGFPMPATGKGVL